MGSDSVSSGVNKLLSLILWITGVLVSLAVGFGMISGTLPVWFIPNIVTSIAGWAVVILTLLSVLLGIIEKFN
ncbi:hypothetical protein COU60_03645 [Candidatus Pacearchaeota archaeon CG10_big_fil_rev_8_21_14_0_10_34_76]|nr:MAG: hypothetical protein COU60_03645 [Candidatus Pacearchaeota archaeon CG10_big_fil_rev_8_21_14_0_10_34_76]